MKPILIFVSLLLTGSIICQDSVSVLFIGNSYIYTNDLPSVFQNITQSKGDIVTIDSKTNGGFTFQNHTTDPLTYQKIHAKPWDFVILQGQSQEPSFPYGQVNSSTLPYAVKLADSVYANAPCSQAMYFMTWGRQNGDPQWDSINTFNKMNLRLRNAYLRIADSAQASVSPSGPAWKYVIDNHPTINLFSGDGSHPSYAGTYLSACVFYSSIFHKSPVGATFIGSLDATTAFILQQAAATTVLDSLSTWRLRHFDSLVEVDFTYIVQGSGNQVQFTSESSSYTENLTWYFGDDTFSFENNPTHDYTFNGTYLVELVGSGVCGSDTVQQVIQIQSVGIDLNSTGNFTVHLNKIGEIEISNLPNGFDANFIRLFEMSGRELSYQVISRENKKLIIKSDFSGEVLLNYFDHQKIIFSKSFYLPQLR